MSSSELLTRIPICPHGTPDLISPDLLRFLMRLEKGLGYPLKYTSGYRCPICNKKVGGSSNSAHLRGLAVDISCLTSTSRFQILSIGLSLGLRRCGVGHHILHMDVDNSLPQDVIWVY